MPNFDDDVDTDFGEFEKLLESNKRSGPCDDDYERTTPWIDMLPEETDGEDVSPLKF